MLDRSTIWTLIRVAGVNLGLTPYHGQGDDHIQSHHTTPSTSRLLYIVTPNRANL